MTLDEAIQNCGKQILKYERQCELGISKEGKEYNSQCATDYKQLAEWLIELKDLREENKELIGECDRLIKEKGELLKKSERIIEYKRLLKSAMEDMKILYESGKDEGCVGIEFKWRYADEALKLIES